MEIKGTAIKTIPEFVKANFPDRYMEWINSLSAESKKIMAETIYSTNWYAMTDAAVEPTKKVGEVFFNNDIKKGAWETGRYSAEVALNGIYKLYVKVSSPGHIIARAGRVFSAYYKPSELETQDQKSNSVNLILTGFDEPSEVMEYRIAGWIERALEISGSKDVKVTIPESLSKGSYRTVFECTWS